MGQVWERTSPRWAGAASHQGPRRMGEWEGANPRSRWALRPSLVAPPYSPCCCIGRGGTISGPPDPSGILRNLLEASRYNTEKPELFPEPEQQLSIYKSLPPDHSGTPRDVQDLIRDSEQHSVTTYKLPL